MMQEDVRNVFSTLFSFFLNIPSTTPPYLPLPPTPVFFKFCLVLEKEIFLLCP